MIVEEGACGPDLPADLHLAPVGVHALEHHGAGPDERSRAGAQGGGCAQVPPCDRPDEQHARKGSADEDDELPDDPDPDEREDAREHGREGDRAEEEREREHLSHRKSDGDEDPDHPFRHNSIVDRVRDVDSSEVAEVEGQVRDRELDEQAEARRRAALVHIRQYPDSVLRLRAKEVADFDDDLRTLVERMQVLMREANGVGLAANQVGVLRRVFVVQIAEDEEPVAVVNPVIVPRSDELASEDEGCLSLGPVRMPVERPVAITLAGQDVHGAELQLELDELASRVVQHEVDHLDGVLIIDRTTPEARREALGFLRPKPVLVV